MNNPLDKLLSLEETASYICTKLKESGIDVVLSGGSCIQIRVFSKKERVFK